MKKFLVTVDFSEVTDDVIESALAFVRALKGKVTLLNIVQPPIVPSTDYALPVGIMQEANAAAEKRARTKLAGYARMFQKAGVACETHVRTGPPVALILREAKRIRADFIVMGSHGHGKLYDFLVGSTASGVIKRAGCGVILLPPEDKAYD